jgi:hypothetical protein
MKFFAPLLFLLLTASLFSVLNAQDSVEVYIIEAYIAPENEDTLKLFFYTSEEASSRLVIDGKYKSSISDTLTETHSALVNLSGYSFSDSVIRCRIYVKSAAGTESVSDVIEVKLPYEPKIEGGSSYLLSCLTGGLIFLTPSVGAAFNESDAKLSFTKDFPLIAYYLGGYNFPAGYFSLEYTHTPEYFPKNLLRAGYKHIFEIPVFSYLSPGLNYTTDFLGLNGVSPELNIGLFSVSNTFTLNLKTRYNWFPSLSARNYGEIYLGLQSFFFTYEL